MLRVDDMEEAVTFAKKFQTLKHVKDYEEKEYSKYLKTVPEKTIYVI